MRFKGVLFDLYGTLVPAFSLPEHTEVIHQCADQLGMPFDDFRRRWVDPSAGRLRGRFPSIAANLAFVAHDAGHAVSDAQIDQAEETYETFTVRALQPVAGALDVLRWFRDRGVRIGLVSNCAPDVPKLWSKSAFADSFDACIFSCDVKATKPSDEIYRKAIAALQLSPAGTLYVGDGSDEELSGARRNGLRAVLVRTDLSNTYDAHRHDVDRWDGPTIDSLSELPELVARL